MTVFSLVLGHSVHIAGCNLEPTVTKAVQFIMHFHYGSQFTTLLVNNQFLLSQHVQRSNNP